MIMMKATRRCYVQSMNREFAPGETFLVQDEKEVRRLMRRRTAQVADAEPAKSPPPPAAPEPAPASATPSYEGEEVDDEPKHKSKRYNRRDMRPEE